ncbi:MAG: trimethylamine methyltransferase family protein [Eubacteriaceae bacterium]
MKLNYTFSNPAEIELIHERSLDVLENVGVIYESELALEYFRKSEAKVDGKKVFIPRKMIEVALKTTTPTFKWIGREKTLSIGEGSSCNIPAYGPILMNRNDQFWNPTPQDYVNFCKLHESSKVINAGNPHMLEPTAIPRELRDSYRMATTLKYHTKPVMGLTTGRKGAELSLNMIQNYYDNHEDVVMTGLINLAAPMHVSEDMGDALVIYAQNGQAICMAAGAGMSGLNAPPSMASNILMSNSVILSGITLAQLINPGTPLIYGFPIFSSDLRYATPAIGGAETALFSFAAKEMAKYYNLPLRTGGGLTDAKQIDYQAGYETFMIELSTKIINTDFVLHSCGIMDSFNTLGYEKFILDEETLLVIERFLKGFIVDEKHLMYEEIKTVGPSGNYLSGRTPKVYREDYFLTQLNNRKSINEWKKTEESVVDKANRIIDERLNEFIIPEFTKEQSQILNKDLPVEYEV